MLEGRKGLARRAFFRIGEGPPVGPYPLTNRVEKFTFPLREGDSGLVGGALGAFEGIERGPLDLRLLVGWAPLQITPSAER